MTAMETQGGLQSTPGREDPAAGRHEQPLPAEDREVRRSTGVHRTSPDPLQDTDRYRLANPYTRDL